MPERIPVRSVRTGGLDYIETASPDEAQVAALKREREGYLMRGLTDRAAAVDVELRRLNPDTKEVSRHERQEDHRGKFRHRS